MVACPFSWIDRSSSLLLGTKKNIMTHQEFIQKIEECKLTFSPKLKRAIYFTMKRMNKKIRKRRLKIKA